MSLGTVTRVPAVPTRQLTVNAAFLKEIKEDNQQLKVLWDQVVPVANRVETASNHWPDLVKRLGELRDQLALHFALEEAYGYFDEAIDIAPQLSMTAAMLRGEHSSLYASIRDIADAAGGISTDRPERIEACIVDFNAFRKRFERHEEAELKLILNAMGEDIGVCD